MKAGTNKALCLLGILLPVALLLGCDEGSSGPTDFIAPELDLVFPTKASYDADGDGLLDVEVAFEDGTTGVDPERIRVRVDGVDVLGGWTITRSDSAGFAAEETLGGLLSSGEHRVTVIVEDRAGNVKSANLRLELPIGDIHRVMDLPNNGDLTQEVRNLAMSPDGRRLYVVASTAELIVVDPESYEIVTRTPSPTGDLWDVKGDWARGRLYAVSFEYPGLVEFDAATGRALRTLPTTQGAFTLAVSHHRSEVYVPIEVHFSDIDGFLSVVDLESGREVDVIESSVRNEDNPNLGLAQHAAVLSEDGNQLYLPNVANQGVLVYDVVHREYVDQIDLLPLEPIMGGPIGGTRAGTFAYFVGWEPHHPWADGAAYKVDLVTHQVVRRVLGNAWDVNGIAASPDGQTLFVVGKSGGRFPQLAPGANYVMDAVGFRLRGVLPDVEPDDRYYGYNAAVWHPDGKRVYVGSTDNSKNQIVVYIVRPQ